MEVLFVVRINSNDMKKLSLVFPGTMIFAQVCTDSVIALTPAGQLIHQQELQAATVQQIAARNWQPGVYFYRVETPSATTSGKLIRE